MLLHPDKHITAFFDLFGGGHVDFDARVAFICTIAFHLGFENLYYEKVAGLLVIVVIFYRVIYAFIILHISLADFRTSFLTSSRTRLSLVK